MSGFREFVKQIEQDPALRKELQARFGDASAGIATKDFAAFAAEKGYRFDVEELHELGDDDLDQVAGGYTVKLDTRAVKIEFSKVLIKFDSFDKFLKLV